MSTPNDGGPAFPSDSACNSWQCRKPSSGMTLRDYFAAHIIGSVLLDVERVSAVAKNVGVQFTEAAALIAYEIADDMLKARSK